MFNVLLWPQKVKCFFTSLVAKIKSSNYLLYSAWYKGYSSTVCYPPPHLGRGGTVYGEGKALTDYQVAINLLGSTVLCNYHLSFWLPPKTNILWVDLEVNLIEVQTKGVRIRSEFHSDRISLFYCRIGFCRFFVGSDLGFSCIASNYSNILTN